MMKRFYLLSVLALLLASCQREHELDRKEALNSLKILNSDLTDLFDQSSGKPWFVALKFLWEQPGSPLPFHRDTSTGKLRIPAYTFADKKGVYTWDEKAKTFSKEKDTTLILVKFPMPSGNREWCRFYLDRYEMMKVKSRPDFPVAAEARLFVGNELALTVSHQATVEENLPRGIATEVIGKEFRFQLRQDRTGNFSKKSGVVSGNILLQAGGHEIISGSCNMEIDYHPPANYSLEDILFSLKVFNTEMKSHIDYRKINPTSNEYAKEFNDHSDIVVKNLDNSGIIGKIVLAFDSGSNKMDFYLRFKDGSQCRFSDQILVLKRLLNYKH